jgi:hypothetical protein
METYDSEGNLIRVEERKMGWWEKIGGGSLLIAAVFHLVLLVIGGFWVFKIIHPPEKVVDFMPPGGGGGERSAQQVQQKKRAQITPSTNVKRVFAEGAQASYSIPEQGDNFGEMSALSSLSGGGMSGGLGGGGAGQGFGKGAGVAGAGLGMGGGAGKIFGLIPETMRKRCSKEDRLQRLAESGGTPACDEAVTKSLRWMKSVQNADGSWGASNKAAMTGLVLLSYFGHCETPVSEEFGESCLRGIVYLTNLGLKTDGKLASNFTSHGWCYEHGIATYALGEAYTFCKELKQDVPGLAEVTEKAGQFIIDNQNKNGGWAYQYGTEKGAHTDVSVVGWQIQALKACSHTNIKYRGMNAAISKGLDYLATCQNDHGGFGYSGKNSHSEYFTLTGVGMLCYQMWGKGKGSEVRKASKYIIENTRFDYNTEFCDLYGHYYESQAMMQIGGDEWKKYNDLFRDQLLNNQEPDGQWKSPGGGKKPRAVAPQFIGSGLDSRIYRNTLCTLMLEVYYRFLNTGGGGSKNRHGI